MQWIVLFAVVVGSRIAQLTGFSEFARYHATLPQRGLDLVLTGAFGLGRKRNPWPLEFFWFAASLSVSLTLFSIPVYTLEPIPSLGDTAYLGLGVLVWSAVLEMVDRGERLARYRHGAGGGTGSFPWVRFLALVVVEVLIYTLSRSHPMIHDPAVRGFFYGVVLAAAADLVNVVYTLLLCTTRGRPLLA